MKLTALWESGRPVNTNSCLANVRTKRVVPGFFLFFSSPLEVDCLGFPSLCGGCSLGREYNGVGRQKTLKEPSPGEEVERL